MEQLSAKIFHAPVKSPEEIKEMEAENEEDLKIVYTFVKNIVNEKAKKKLPKDNIRKKKLIDFMRKGLEVDCGRVKEFFEFISDHYLYGPARGPQKYLVLIVTRKYSFIYHIKLEESVSFERGIRKFVKYLDSSNLLRFIYRDIDGYFKIFDKNNSKGWKKLLGIQPEYEAKGNVKVRIKRSEKTDVVVETYIDDIENIKDSIEFKWKDKEADIKLEGGEITRVTFSGENVRLEDVPKKIKYERLGIREFMAKCGHQIKDSEIEESKEWIEFGDNRIQKPNQRNAKEILNGKEETFFIFGGSAKSEKLTKEIKDEMKNVFNLGFVELSGFSKEYKTVKIGDFEIFGKIKPNATMMKETEDTFNEIISKTKSNLALTKLIRYVGLLTLCEEFLLSEGFRDKIQKPIKENLKEHFRRLDKSIDLEEIDKFCIEFKSGDFFENKPKKLAKELLKKLGKKLGGRKICVYFIGVDEDRRKLTPIRLTRMRNEYREELKKNLEEQGIEVLLIETIPTSDEEGILIIVLYQEIADFPEEFTS
ncbi:MAG: hypothetical protein H5T36_00190 [Methanobacteriaceae archaeon]|nr:hypothetical protein [Methanobacteriaceae archaeon]